jgi:TamB, inner membrane protein subunit of TAM complex
MARRRWLAMVVRLLRGLAWAVGLAVALALAGVSAVILYARTEEGRATVRDLALRHAREAIPGLDFARVGGDYLRGFNLDDVTVFDGEGRRAVHIERIGVRYRLLPLLRRRVAVRELEIEGPEVLGRPDPDGALNLTRLLAPTPAERRPDSAAPAAPSRWRVHVDRLLVTRGAADVRDAAGDTTLVSGLSLDGAAALDGADLRASLHSLVVRVETGGRRIDAAVAGDIRLRGDDLVVRVAHLRLGGVLPSDTIDVSGRVAGPRRRLTVTADVSAGPAGLAVIDGTVGLAGGSAPGATALGDYDLHLRASEVSLARIVAGGPDGRVGLVATARGRGVPLAPGSASRLVVDVPATRLAGIHVGPARLEARSDGTRWALGPAVVRASGARVTLAGHGEGGDVQGEIIAEVTGPLPGRHHAPLADVRGRGHLALRVAASLPGHLEVSAAGTARGVAAGAFRLESLSLRGHATMGRDHAHRSPSRAAPRFDLKAAAVRGDVRLAAQGIEAGAAAPRIDTLTLAAQSDGQALRLHASAAGRRLHADVDLHGQLSARAARVTLDRLGLSYQTPAYKQALALAHPTSIDARAGDAITLQAAELRGTGFLLTGRAIVHGSYSLAPASRGPRATLALGLREASIAGSPRIEADLAATLEASRLLAQAEAAVAHGRVHLDAALPLATPPGGAPRLAARGPIAVHLTTSALEVQQLPFLVRRLALAGVTDGTLDASAAIDGDIARPEGSARLDLRDVNLRSPRDLLGPAQRRQAVPGAGVSLRLEASEGHLHLAGTASLRHAEVLKIDVRSDAGLAAVMGGKPLADAPLQARIDIPAVELASLAVLAPALEGVSGTLTGHIDASGTPRRLTGRGDLAVGGARVDAIALGRVVVHAEADDGHLDLTGHVVQASGGDVQAHAHVARGGPLTAHLAVQNLDLGLLRPFVPRARELGGTLQAAADVTGSLAAPVVRGSLGLARGRIGLIGQPTFTDVTAQASLAPGRAELRSLTLRSGGKLQAHGWAKLEGLTPLSAVLAAHADGFVVAIGGNTGARIDGDLAVEGALRDAVIAGKVNVPRAVVWLPQGATTGGRDLQKVGPRADVRFVDAAAQAAQQRRDRQARAAGPPPTLDVDAQAGAINVRSRDMDFEVESRLHIATVSSGPDAGKPTLTGTVRVVRGRLNISGQRFDFDRGTLSFNGDPDLNPTLDIRLTRQFPEATVAIEIRGTPKHPDLRLTSDPPIYDQTQIVSLLLSGQASAQPSDGKPFDATGTITTMVLGRLADQLAPSLGLDVVRIENVQQVTAQGRPSGQTDTRVEVGKYVTDRIFVSYAHVFGALENANTNEAHLEYRLSRRWMLESVFGDAGVGSLDALWTYRY